jgi:hypothetical protein
MDDIEDVIRVEFDGVELERVDILSTTQLQVIVPAFTGTGDAATAEPIGAIDITITNLDDSGDPILGETVTEASAYTYTRTPIRDPDATQANQIYRRVVYEVIRTFQRQLIGGKAGVAIGTDVDYGTFGEVVSLTSTVPSISLVGPRLLENFETRHMWADFEYTSDAQPADEYWPSYVTNLEFDYVLASDKRRELLGMVQGLVEVFSRTPYLRIPSVVGDYTSSMHEFPFVLMLAPTVTIPKPNSNLSQAIGMFEVRNVPFRLGERIDAIYEVLEGNLLVNQLGTSLDDEESVTFADED